jgi:hypothetical protein
MIDKLNEIWQTLGALIARHPSVAILLLFLLLLARREHPRMAEKSEALRSKTRD